MLLKHGLLAMVEVKLDKFKLEAATKLHLTAEQVKTPGSKAYLYYINVDIKFILKARLYLLRQAFEHSVTESKTQAGATYACDQCEYGRMKDKIYSTVDANSLAFRCPQCKSDLKIFEQESALGDEDQARCRQAISALLRRVQKFDDYVIPANFFGPGKLQAYVGLSSQFDFEDAQNVNFVMDAACREYLGLVPKQKCEVTVTVTPELQTAVDYYCELERNHLKR